MLSGLSLAAGYGVGFRSEPWRAATDPPGWTDEGIARLKAHLRRGR